MKKFLGSLQNWTILWGHFYPFYGFFLKVKVQNHECEYFLGVAKISNIFFGMPDIPDIFFG